MATGESYSVRDFLETAFSLAGLDWKQHVEFDPRYLRPAEVDHLEGDATRTREALGWKPQTDFKTLVGMMVEHDHDLARRERSLVDAGHDIHTSGQD